MELVPLYRRAGFRTAIGLMLWFLAYILLLIVGDVETTPGILLIDIALGLVSILLITALVAQFVLPVRHTRERVDAVRHLLNYTLGSRGPVISVQNGRMVEAKKDDRKSPGVLLLDHTSGAVLRTETAFFPPLGPGLHFTTPDQRLGETLDLRRQRRELKGIPPQTGEADLEANPTLALTKEGIPIAADLSVTFMLDPGHTSAPREGRHPDIPPYEFNQQAAERAILGHAYDAEKDMPWTELPIRLVVDLWRETVKEHSLENLFIVEDDTQSPISSLRSAIFIRLTSPMTTILEEDGGMRRENSREYHLLTARGIRVLDVELTNLYLPDEVQRERTQHWCDAWSTEAQSALTEVERLQDEARTEGIQEASERLLQELTAGLRTALRQEENPGMRDTLTILLKDAARICSQTNIVFDGKALTQHMRTIADSVSRLDV
jgi:regulator of protease activity HflC (stomatin/prohibitin superfamily)